MTYEGHFYIGGASYELDPDGARSPLQARASVRSDLRIVTTDDGEAVLKRPALGWTDGPAREAAVEQLRHEGSMGQETINRDLPTAYLGCGEAPEPHVLTSFVEGRVALSVARADLRREQAPALAVTLFRHVDQVHRAGLIHRDIKPGNILVERRGDDDVSSDEALLIDYSNAMVAQNPNSDPISPSDPIQYAGTPGWMCPCCVEKPQRDAACDVFSAALVIYAVAVGLDNGTPLATVTTREAVEASLKQLTISLVQPPALRQVLRSALKAAPESRISAADALRLLEQDDNGGLVEGPETGPIPLGAGDRIELGGDVVPGVAGADDGGHGLDEPEGVDDGLDPTQESEPLESRPDGVVLGGDDPTLVGGLDVGTVVADPAAAWRPASAVAEVGQFPEDAATAEADEVATELNGAAADVEPEPERAADVASEPSDRPSPAAEPETEPIGPSPSHRVDDERDAFATAAQGTDRRMVTVGLPTVEEFRRSSRRVDELLRAKDYQVGVTPRPSGWSQRLQDVGVSAQVVKVVAAAALGLLVLVFLVALVAG